LAFRAARPTPPFAPLISDKVTIAAMCEPHAGGLLCLNAVAVLMTDLDAGG
jgi:hypothetical protein